MSYDYLTEKKTLFTDDGQRLFLKARDEVKRLLAQSGAARMQEIIGAIGCGDTWTMLACLDRMIELGELAEITGPDCAGQYRVFIERLR